VLKISELIFKNFTVTLKPDSEIRVVFTWMDSEIYVHLEFYDEKGKLVKNTRKRKWRY